jgi:hypothetical protein
MGILIARHPEHRIDAVASFGSVRLSILRAKFWRKYKEAGTTVKNLN